VQPVAHTAAVQGELAAQSAAVQLAELVESRAAQLVVRLEELAEQRRAWAAAQRVVRRSAVRRRRLAVEPAEAWQRVQMRVVLAPAAQREPRASEPLGVERVVSVELLVESAVPVLRALERPAARAVVSASVELRVESATQAPRASGRPARAVESALALRASGPPAARAVESAALRASGPPAARAVESAGLALRASGRPAARAVESAAPVLQALERPAAESARRERRALEPPERVESAEPRVSGSPELRPTAGSVPRTSAGRRVRRRLARAA
jgi:hypothetical protein